MGVNSFYSNNTNDFEIRSQIVSDVKQAENVWKHFNSYWMGAVAGLVIGGALAGALLAVATMLVWRRVRGQRRSAVPTEEVEHRASYDSIAVAKGAARVGILGVRKRSG
jgi:hypothetical protein